VNDRRLLLLFILVMAIAFGPMFLFRQRAPANGNGPTPTTAESLQATPPVPSSVAAAAPPVSPSVQPTSAASSGVPVPPGPDRTIPVRSPLYEYDVSVWGGRIVGARLLHYKSTAPGEKGDTLQLLSPGWPLLASQLVVGSDTVHLDQIEFEPSADYLAVNDGPATLTLRGSSGRYDITMEYRFVPDSYHVAVSGTITGLGATGATMLVGLGDGFRNTEADPRDNERSSGVVTKTDKTSLLQFGKLKPMQERTLSGPFEWTAVKSKYFVAALFAYDSTGPKSYIGKIGGVRLNVTDTFKTPTRAHVAASLVVPPSGSFDARLYIGPMEYARLSAEGHQFDDVNPYGWAWMRPIIRPFAFVIRALFVWMHHTIGLGYGLVIVLFGILARVITWPLNRKAMRSMLAMQAIQPMVSELQDRYKDNPQQLNQEMFRLYRENHVNPLSGCWPMMIPYPLLIAVYFVLAYSIEVRGVSFLWMPDLSRADPLFLIPVIMAVSQFILAKIGQIGMPPNPQAKMMMYAMPAVFLFLFSRLASGLNLYYAVLNIASLPQQWLVVKERQLAKATGVMPGAKKKREKG
jgi:YidC/Oxa1 family membrane protein insertase